MANLKQACRITRAGTKIVFKLPGKCTDKYINSPFYKGALLWDALPNHVQRSESIMEFEKHVKPLYAKYRNMFAN